MPHLLSIEAERRRQPPATATSSASTPYTSDGRTAATADRERGLHWRRRDKHQPPADKLAEEATAILSAAFPVWLATGAGFPTPSP
uniref:Uncharacterized protein n=1 Tax=Oryza meridionalis TaxID=40149 RepID=A0A0E0DB36_9ORYZ